MPLPFVIGAAIGVGTALFGVKKGLDAKEDMEAAKQINEEGQTIYKKAESIIDTARKNTNKELENLGIKRNDILKTSIKSFTETFKKIKNIEDAKDEIGIDKLKEINKEILEMQEAAFTAVELAAGGTGAVAAGSLAAAGAYGAVGAIGAASTGAAISGLGGVAATNATLAWFGGGSLAMGGMGMAGGMAVLGGLVAGPALAVGGVFLSSKAETALYDAKSYRDKANEFMSQADVIVSMCEHIGKCVEQIDNLQDRFNKLLIVLINHLKTLLMTEGTDFRSYDNYGKNLVLTNRRLALMLFDIINTPILNSEDGSIHERFKFKIDEKENEIKTLLPNIDRLLQGNSAVVQDRRNTKRNESIENYNLSPADAAHYQSMITRAENGDSQAFFDLGVVFERGKYGIPINREVARKWYKKAAEKGIPAAKFRLNQLEKNPNGYPKVSL